jgi:multicomponent Na+:H+ antiporter subunit D
MSLVTSILASLFIPLLGAILIFSYRRFPRLVEIIFVSSAAALLLVTLSIFNFGSEVYHQTHALYPLIGNIPLAFHIEPLGLVYAGVASSLWLITTIYAIGYMNANQEKKLARFYMCFCIAMMGVMGIAFAANLLTLFIFYEILTISTYPLVAHKENADAKNGARAYLGLLLTTSIGFFLVSILWTWQVSHSLDFTIGGILTGKLSDGLTLVLFTLMILGIGKAGLMPFHRWLPAAMVAPTPVSALLHAVAVVKAGVFCVLKITVYIFGIDLLQSTNANQVIIILATVTMLLASLVALQQDNLKARLAYSTISQLAYIVLGAAIATSVSIVGASMHLATHAVGKITLFFCAGAIYTATKKTSIKDMHGIGYQMPFTMVAYTVAAISIIGLPPMVGSWSKWFLVDGALSSGQIVLAIAFLISTLLNIVYLMPIAINAFASKPSEADSHYREAPKSLVLPLCITAFLCLALFFLMPYFYQFLQTIP